MCIFTDFLLREMSEGRLGYIISPSNKLSQGTTNLGHFCDSAYRHKVLSLSALTSWKRVKKLTETKNNFQYFSLGKLHLIKIYFNVRMLHQHILKLFLKQSGSVQKVVFAHGKLKSYHETIKVVTKNIDISYLRWLFSNLRWLFPWETKSFPQKVSKPQATLTSQMKILPTLCDLLIKDRQHIGNRSQSLNFYPKKN